MARRGDFMTPDVIENQVAPADAKAAAHTLSLQASGLGLSEHRIATSSMQPKADTNQLGLPVFEGFATRDNTRATTVELSPRDKLVASLERSGVSTQGIEDFKSNLERFERNVADRGLPASTANDTYKQLDRILNSGNSTVPRDLKSQFVTQWSSKLADPASVKQGWHDTCGMGYYQTYALMNHPKELTRTMADVLTRGAATVPDDSRSRIGMMFYERTLLPQSTRQVSVDKASLRPDLEAQGKSQHADARDYADQVAQVVLNTIKWDMREKAPDGTRTTQGSMKFKQCEDVKRPADSPDPKIGADKSCESVEETGFFGGKTVHDANGYGFGGQSTARDIDRVHFGITGKHNILTLDGGKGALNSPEQLEQFIRSRSHMPMGLFVTPNSEAFAQSYLDRHPEKTSVPSGVMLHIVGVNGINTDGTIDVINPWGKRHALTAKQLFEAMQF